MALRKADHRWTYLKTDVETLNAEKPNAGIGNIKP